MTAGILYLYIIGNADAKSEARICFMIAGGWALISIIYIAVTTVRKTYRLKIVSGMIRPEQLNVVVQALKEDDCILGMTVTKVKGLGRQRGALGQDTDPDRISFIPKVRVDVVVKEWDVPQIMDVMSEAARTGNSETKKASFVLENISRNIAGKTATFFAAIVAAIKSIGLAMVDIAANDAVNAFRTLQTDG